MARLARAVVFDPGEVSVFHCINRCVRRCFLCGHDPLTGNNFDHRKQWLDDRFRLLAACPRNRCAGVFHPFQDSRNERLHIGAAAVGAKAGCPVGLQAGCPHCPHCPRPHCPRLIVEHIAEDLQFGDRAGKVIIPPLPTHGWVRDCRAAIKRSRQRMGTPGFPSTPSARRCRHCCKSASSPCLSRGRSSRRLATRNCNGSYSWCWHSRQSQWLNYTERGGKWHVLTSTTRKRVNQ